MAKVSVIITRQTMASGVAHQASKGPVELSSRDAAVLIAMGKAVAYVAKPEPVKAFVTGVAEEATNDSLSVEEAFDDAAEEPVAIAPQKRSYRRRRKV